MKTINTGELEKQLHIKATYLPMRTLLQYGPVYSTGLDLIIDITKYEFL